jgi:hypothetical protein
MARCTCGSVEIEAIGAPIMSVVCYCDDCQEGARRIEALPDAPAVRDRDGGSAYVLYRKDRVFYTRGAELLHGHKLNEKSPTKRVVATCCNAAMFLDFNKGHWISAYRARFQGEVPPVQMRIGTKSMGAGQVPNDVPSSATFPLKFVGKLVAARIAMLLGR